ncbi:MAG: hypothetical protein ABSA16_13505 [Thermoguttaceae bacterium]|jgi:hypothetical protein
MWLCPECKHKNPALSDQCTVCGTSPDGTKKTAETRAGKDVGVTRRFSVGTFMIMMAFFGVLFAILKMLNVHPIIFCCIAVFFAGIGVAQMSLFGGNEPRKASWIAGFPLGFVCGLGGMIAAKLFYQLPAVSGEILGESIFCAVMGGPCGYLAGCLIAGIFLVRERESAEENDAQDTFNETQEEDDD